MTENATMAFDDVAVTVTSLATSASEKLLDMFNTTGAAVLDSDAEAPWLHPAQEQGAKELYEMYGPQVCEVKPLQLTSRVRIF